MLAHWRRKDTKEVVETAVGDGSDDNVSQGDFPEDCYVEGKRVEVSGGCAVWDEISLGGTFIDGDAYCHCSKGRQV